MKKKYLTLRIIRPSGREGQEILLTELIESLRNKGHDIRVDDHPFDETTPWVSGNIANRRQELIAAVEESDTDAILCAKGGYGCSDLLPTLPWDDWVHLPPKIIIGFSDITALLAAFHTKLGWESLHGPMPATKLWTQGAWECLQNILTQDDSEHTLPLASYNQTPLQSLNGKLIGGCLSVLSCLIGTPWISSLNRSFLFLEDINENPGQIMRNWNQITQSEIFTGVQGIILGDFIGTEIDFKPYFTQNLDIPVWTTEFIGHHKKNLHIGFGTKATIAHNTLRWRIT